MAEVDRSRYDTLISIIEHVKTALELADRGHEHVLGAKLNDVLICAVERCETIARDLETYDDPERFRERLRKLVKRRPTSETEKPE